MEHLEAFRKMITFVTDEKTADMYTDVVQTAIDRAQGK